MSARPERHLGTAAFRLCAVLAGVPPFRLSECAPIPQRFSEYFLWVIYFSCFYLGLYCTPASFMTYYILERQLERRLFKTHEVYLILLQYFWSRWRAIFEMFIL